MEERQTVGSRQQRVMEAKARFSENSVNGKPNHTGRNVRRSGLDEKQHSSNIFAVNGGMSGNWTEEEASFYEKWRIRRCFALLRFMMATAIVFLLIAAFSQDFSYRGFDQEYVQEQLEDETTWNVLEKRVQDIYRNLTEKK